MFRPELLAKRRNQRAGPADLSQTLTVNAETQLSAQSASCDEKNTSAALDADSRERTLRQSRVTAVDVDAAY